MCTENPNMNVSNEIKVISKILGFSENNLRKY